jgi:AcrR family transcriptional regulator
MLREVPPGSRSGPRRERKKRQTREALIHAALELFDAKGYEHTAVREITDAVDVSERTFFRYFANKEDLALSFVRDAREVMLKALAARPAEEEPLIALRNAMHESLEVFGPDGDDADGDGDSDGEPAYFKVTRLIDATPSLLAANLRYLHEHDDDIVGVLARREGVDPETDLRPRLVAAVFGGLIFVATRDWRKQGRCDADAMLAAFDAYVEQVRPALAGHWT